ncbi:glycosyltransferase [Pleurocapsales cyanobacterium LEGE 10410]|nr:glycosyltransferase [Pleurocapsales cyanobacterium LEGE 10410]
MSEPQVTIVVVPRERFSCARQSLESIYEHTKIPFKLIYIDGNSPAKTKLYLQEQAKQNNNFKLIRTECYLYPNQARNLGLQQVDTKYVVFIDNDVIVTTGWLTNLVDCAEATKAGVVGPLMCQYEPLHEIVHFAGGESHIFVDKKGRRRLREKMYLQGKRVADVRSQLQRTQTELAEFHCVLVRRDIFDRVGMLDEAFLNTKEHLDFCMTVREAGEKVYFEPDCVVTYLPGPPIETSDLHYYMLRWSNAWQMASLKRMLEKWSLAEDAYFTTKYKRLCWRRYGTIIEPLAHRLTFGLGADFMARAIATIDNGVNRVLTDNHKRTQKKQLSQLKQN